MKYDDTYKLLIEFLNPIFNQISDKKNSDIALEVNNDEEDYALLVENIKKGYIKLEDLMIGDLVKVQQIMSSEIDSLDDEIQLFEEENANLIIKINSYRTENTKLKAKLRN